jgi:hypothetical protein
MLNPVPSHWYNSPYYIPEGAPVPSGGNYTPENVAWVIELFAQVLEKDKTELRFCYPNNTEDVPEDDILVDHPNDKNYLPALRYKLATTPKSKELLRYEAAAKKSSILKLYEENSPAGIKYFQ